MHNLLRKAANIFGPGKVFKTLFNISPMYRRTGGRIILVSDDLSYVKIKLKLNYKTRNYVGTLYGGHMYSCVDGIHMVQLIEKLGSDYVVWDKSASIKFKRPGNQTLFAEFSVPDEMINNIKAEIALNSEKDYTFSTSLVDKEGKIYAEVEKLIYISSKDFYKQKRKTKN